MKKIFRLAIFTFIFFFGLISVNAAKGSWNGSYCSGTCGGYTSAGTCDKVHNTSVGLFRVSFYLNGSQIGSPVNIASSSSWSSMASSATYHWGNGNTSIVQYAKGAGLSVSNGGISTIVINGISTSNVKSILSPSSNSSNVQSVLNAAGITNFKFENGKIKYKPSNVNASSDECKGNYEIQMIVEAMQVITWGCDSSYHGIDFVGTAYELNNGLLELGYDSTSGGNGYMSGSIVDKNLLSALRLSRNQKVAGVSFTSVSDCLTVHIRGYGATSGYGMNIYDLKSDFEIDCGETTTSKTTTSSSTSKKTSSTTPITGLCDATVDLEACCNCDTSSSEKNVRYRKEDGKIYRATCGAYLKDVTQRGYCKPSTTPSAGFCDATVNLDACCNCDISSSEKNVRYKKEDGKTYKNTCSGYLKYAISKGYCVNQPTPPTPPNQTCIFKDSNDCTAQFLRDCCYNSDFDLNTFISTCKEKVPETLINQYCPVPQKCEVPVLEGVSSCEPANCDEGNSNISTFKDPVFSGSNGSSDLLVMGSSGIDLEKTQEKLNQLDSLLESFAKSKDKSSFSAVAGAGELYKENIKYDDGSDNEYCDLYCQEIAVVTLPDYYPGVNAGRYFQWYISGDENKSLVKQQIVKVCAEDIKFDKFIEEYYDWMTEVQNVINKYENVHACTDSVNCALEEENRPKASISDAIANGTINWTNSCNNLSLWCLNNLTQKVKRKVVDQDKRNKCMEDADYEYSFVPPIEVIGLFEYDRRTREIDMRKEECFNNAYIEIEVPLDTSLCDQLNRECRSNSNKYNRNALLNDFSQIKTKIENKFKRYLSCLKDDISISSSSDSDLHLKVINELSSESYDKFTKNSTGDVKTLKSNSKCVDLGDNCTPEKDKSYFTYAPVINGTYDNSMTCGAGSWRETTIKDTNNVPNFVSGSNISFAQLPYSISADSFYHSGNSIFWDRSKFTQTLGQIAGRDDFAKSIRLLALVSESSYSLDDTVGTCICSDGTTVELEKDGSNYYCPCKAEVSYTSSISSSSNVDDAILDIGNSYGRCKYSGYTKLTDEGSYIVKYSTQSGAYKLDINYSNIGSVVNGKAHFADVNCSSSGDSQCNGGECKYSGQYCKILVGNSLMYDNWSNEKTKNWKLEASFYMCASGECFSCTPDECTVVCNEGECEPVINNPNCPDGNCPPGGGNSDIVCSGDDCPITPQTCENGSCLNTTGMSVIYRTVDLNNPFPDRKAGQNWVDSTSRISENRGVSGTSLYSSNVRPLYRFELNPASIKQIREINAQRGYDYSNTNTIAYPGGTDQSSGNGKSGKIYDDEKNEYNAGVSQLLRNEIAKVIKEKSDKNLEEASVYILGYSNDTCPDDKDGKEYCEKIMTTINDVMVGDSACWNNAASYLQIPWSQIASTLGIK